MGKRFWIAVQSGLRGQAWLYRDSGLSPKPFRRGLGGMGVGDEGCFFIGSHFHLNCFDWSGNSVDVGDSEYRLGVLVALYLSFLE